jgi:hypothetical protein
VTSALRLSNLSYTIEMITPHNSDARISNNEKWPPPSLFDVAYGAALKRWTVSPFIEFAKIGTQIFTTYPENNDVIIWWCRQVQNCEKLAIQ